MSADAPHECHPLVAAASRDPSVLDRAERSARIGSWRWDVERAEAVWSPNLYRLFGLTPQPERPTPDDFLGVIHPHDRAQVRRVLERVLAGGEHPPHEYRVVHADGRVVHLLSSAAVASGGRGSGRVVLGLVKDISERRASERVAELNRAVADALALWDAFRPGVERLLAGLGDALDAGAAALWAPENGTLALRALWAEDALGRGALQRRLGQLRPRKGSCLAGRAWGEVAPRALPLDQAPGVAGARGQDMEAVLAFPAVAGEEVLAVVVIYARFPFDDGPLLTEALSGLGRQLGAFLARRPAALRLPLSPRETEVLTLAAQGLAGPAIAVKLSLSSATVKTHLANAYAKLGVSSRVAAVAYALREGLIE